VALDAKPETPMTLPDDGEDTSAWLDKFDAPGWLSAARSELHRAEASYAEGATRAGLAHARRAAGMALNATLVVRPREWGRSYVDHIRALAVDDTAPELVRRACKTLLDAPMPGAAGTLIALRKSKQETTCLEATRDVIAHAYAVVIRSGPKEET